MGKRTFLSTAENRRIALGQHARVSEAYTTSLEKNADFALPNPDCRPKLKNRRGFATGSIFVIQRAARLVVVVVDVVGMT